MTAPDITELVERLEKATGPDREINARLECLRMGWDFERWPEPSEGTYGFFAWEKTRGCIDPLVRAPDPPGYTSSVDAALALIERVLPGMSWSVRKSGFGNPAQAELYDPMKSPGNGNSYRAEHNGGSAPLALCLALLRALPTIEGEER